MNNRQRMLLRTSAFILFVVALWFVFSCVAESSTMFNVMYAPAPLPPVPKTSSAAPLTHEELRWMNFIRWGHDVWRVQFRDGYFICYDMDWRGIGHVWGGSYTIERDTVRVDQHVYWYYGVGLPPSREMNLGPLYFKLRHERGRLIGTSRGTDWGKSISVEFNQTRP